MRVLYLAPMVPYPTTDGGRQRLHYLLLGLLAEHEVFFAATSAAEEQTADWPLANRFLAPPVIVPVHHQRAMGRTPALLSPGPLKPSTVRRSYTSAFWDRLCELPLESIDVVHVEGAGLAGYGLAIKALYPRVRLVVDTHNVEWHLRARTASAVAHWWRKGAQLRRMADALKWYWFERTTLAHYDSILVCSEEDKLRLSGWAGDCAIDVIPNCADVSLGALAPAPHASKDLVFVGMMSYRPNVEGVEFFCKTVWPRIRAAEPSAEFWIVGKGVSDEVRALAMEGNGVHVTGMVPDVRPFLERAVGTVVPLLSGGGTRLKILEAMAAGRAVVATSIGAEGIEAVDNQEILFADSIEELAERCIALLRDPSLRNRIAAGGRELVARKYDWRQAQKLLLDRYATLTSRSH